MKINYNFLQELNQPNFQPPEWVFNIVWPLLYTLMFVSFYIFLNTKNNQSHIFGVWLFLIQLVLNFAWTPIFFAFKRIKLALFVTILLTITVFYMIIIFSKISPIAGLMNIPYLIWLTFADILNFYLYKLN